MSTILLVLALSTFGARLLLVHCTRRRRSSTWLLPLSAWLSFPFACLCFRLLSTRYQIADSPSTSTVVLPACCAWLSEPHAFPTKPIKVIPILPGSQKQQRRGSLRLSLQPIRIDVYTLASNKKKRINSAA